MLTDRIHVHHLTSADEPEDFFADGFTTLFPDETRNQHGDPDTIVIYRSDVYGDISLKVPDPTSEENRKLFAHYLWNAAVYLASLIEDGGDRFRISGETVLELGAGLGLCGIASALSGAKSVTITDYEAPEILTNLRTNVDAAMKSSQSNQVNVIGHTWGETQDSFAKGHGHAYSRVLAADCLWMPWEHLNLAKSIAHFLSNGEDARAWVVAGFHTGRPKVAEFFQPNGVLRDVGLIVESIDEVDTFGTRRDWLPDRIEDITERKRWIVAATLKHSHV